MTNSFNTSGASVEAWNMGDHAVLMRLSISIPGEERQDPDLSTSVKREHKLGAESGKWVKKLYPPEALSKIKKTDNEARALHGALTLPYDQGIGILPAKLIPTYSEKMRHFAGVRENLIDNEFLADPAKWTGGPGGSTMGPLTRTFTPVATG